MNIYVAGNSDKCTSDDMRYVIQLLTQHGHTVVGSCFSQFLNNFQPNDSAELIITLGGDGTIIKAVSTMGTNQKPIIGINFGKLGYLAGFTITTFKDHLKGGIYRSVSQRHLLEVIVQDEKYLAVNDLVIDIGKPFRVTEVQIRIDNDQLPTFRGDGVIIATPTGSTAYNLSATGPIVEPNSRNLIITPKNPHKLSIRPIVVSDIHTLEIQCAGQGVYAIIDGQVHGEIHQNDLIIVRRHSSQMKIIHTLSHWDTLAEKLGWWS